MLDLQNVHPFENMIAHRYHLLDSTINVQLCALDASHIYETSDHNSQPVEAPVNLLPATCLNADELEFDIQDYSTVDDNDQFFLSPVWHSRRNTPESEETVAVQRDHDNLWSLRQQVDAIDQTQRPGAYQSMEPHLLSRIHEVTNESGPPQSQYYNVAIHRNATEDNINNSYTTIADPYKLEEYGVYIDGDNWSERQHQEINNEEIQEVPKLRNRLLKIDKTAELSQQQIRDMLSAGSLNTVTRKMLKKRRVNMIRSVVSALLLSTTCSAHAIELKEMWRQQYHISYAHVTQRACAMEFLGRSDHSHPGYEEEFFAVDFDDILNLEHPEEARGPASDNASDIFIWNQMEHPGDESNDAKDSRSVNPGKIASRSVASISSMGLPSMFRHDSQTSFRLRSVSYFDAQDEQRERLVGYEHVVATEFQQQLVRLNGVDTDTENFYM
ncbi:hypothetical protein VKS41_000452 [Umbelopsis sp. WA50703]